MNTSKILSNGLFNPLSIPFFASGKIDFDSLAFNINRYNNSKIAGVVLHGTTGESVLLNNDEKIELVKFVKSILSPNKHFIVSTGCESTCETIKFTNQVTKYGANFALILPPHYYTKCITEDQVFIMHFKQICNDVDIPILIYNMPKYTGVNLSINIVRQLLDEKKIVGMKECDNNIVKITQLMDIFGNNHKLYVGSASLIFSTISLNLAHGGICALGNIFPNLLSYFIAKLLNFLTLKNHEIQEMQKFNRFIISTNELCSKYGIPGYKVAMDIVGLKGGFARPPLYYLNKGLIYQNIHKHLLSCQSIIDLDKIL